MALTTVSTQIKINPNFAGNVMTSKQLCWLTNAIKDYNLTLDLDTIETVSQASKHITRIQSAINSGKITKSAPVVSSIWFVIIGDRVQGVLADNQPTYSNVAIKTFTGTELEMKAKVNAKYANSRISYTKDIEVAKKSAKEYASMINTAIVNPMLEVACDKTSAEITMDTLNALSIEDLRQLAGDMGVNLGRSKARNTIIARILA